MAQNAVLILVMTGRKSRMSPSSCSREMTPSAFMADEPTNHLDLEACVWLEETLKSYPSILLMVSHSQDFLNGVCNNIIYMGQKKLTYYSGVTRAVLWGHELHEGLCLCACAPV